MKFKECLFEIIKNGVAVHCDTEEKAKALLKELAGHGVRWRGCSDLTTDTEWNQYKAETCYQLVTQSGLDFLTFSNRENCETEGDKIIKFEELLEAKDRQENDNDNCDNLIDEMEKITDDLKASAELHFLDVLHDAKEYKNGYVKACEDFFEKIKDMLEDLKDN